MVTRMRSPRYPSITLRDAIEFISTIHDTERTNPIDREVAAQAMGYSGISGRSAKVLSSLIQYGLLEKRGKNEVRVSRRSVEILYPGSRESKVHALTDSAFEPELFKRINERFPDGRPSEASLRSYFTKEEFTNAAIPPAIRAYLDTCQFLEDEGGVMGAEGVSAFGQEIELYQLDKDFVEKKYPTPGSGAEKKEEKKYTHRPEVGGKKDGFRVVIANNRIEVGGMLSTKSEADEFVNLISKIRDILPDSLGEGLEPDSVDNGLEDDK